MTDAAATFAATFAALYAAHHVGDHWVQTHRQACVKGQPGWPGRLACLAHVATYTLTALVAVGLVWWLYNLPLHPAAVVAGLTVSAVTHYVVDRRTPLRRLAAWLGKTRFHDLGLPRLGYDDNPSLGSGAYALDQSWHIGWTLVAALVIA